jgi:hypothetical protein
MTNIVYYGMEERKIFSEEPNCELIKFYNNKQLQIQDDLNKKTAEKKEQENKDYFQAGFDSIAFDSWRQLIVTLHYLQEERISEELLIEKLQEEKTYRENFNKEFLLSTQQTKTIPSTTTDLIKNTTIKIDALLSQIQTEYTEAIREITKASDTWQKERYETGMKEIAAKTRESFPDLMSSETEEKIAKTPSLLDIQKYAPHLSEKIKNDYKTEMQSTIPNAPPLEISKNSQQAAGNALNRAALLQNVLLELLLTHPQIAKQGSVSHIIEAVTNTKPALQQLINDRKVLQSEATHFTTYSLETNRQYENITTELKNTKKEILNLQENNSPEAYAQIKKINDNITLASNAPAPLFMNKNDTPEPLRRGMQNS